MNKKKPARRCMGCNESKEKNELIRIVRTTEGDVQIDLTGKKNGRGAYIKKDSEVLLLAKKNKALERALETTIDDSVYDEILNIINN